ncbi:MAG: hypothetical protein R3F65_12630 [bacterium]
MSTERSPYGREIHYWHSDFTLDFLCELPLASARGALPAGVEPVEVRPGVALISLSLTAFEPGNVGYLPRFGEATCSVIVQPDLSGDAAPDFAMGVVRITSDSPQFLRWARHKDKMPVYRGRDVLVCFERDRLGGHAADAEGPIFALCNTHPAPRYEDEVFEVQVFTEADGARWQVPTRWAGRAFRHQRAGATVQIHDHPMLAPLRLGTRALRCHTQMMTPPRSSVVMSFEEPIRLR